MVNGNGSNLSREQIKNLCLRYERELAGVKDWMFWFLLLWTIALLVMEWRQFFSGHAVPTSMVAGYVVLLGSYIAHKEVLRWTGVTAKMRRGEFFVYVWWGTLFFMYGLEYLGGRFAVREGMMTLAYEVLGYFILGEVSKSYNAWYVDRQARREGKRGA